MHYLKHYESDIYIYIYKIYFVIGKIINALWDYVYKKKV